MNTWTQKLPYTYMHANPDKVQQYSRGNNMKTKYTQDNVRRLRDISYDGFMHLCNVVD